MMDLTETYNEIDIDIGDLRIKGNLRLTQPSKGMVVFSHGSGSSRLSSRNNFVADFLLDYGFSSLLFDLLTKEEDCIYANRFDIDLLATRLLKVTKWLKKYNASKNLPVGYFGASTGAASALKAAVANNNILAIVSRGGRPDLALEALNKVKIPTLLLVGGNDEVVIELNKNAQAKIPGICSLRIIEGASHLFSEPGKLTLVAEETVSWFNKYLNV